MSEIPDSQDRRKYYYYCYFLNDKEYQSHEIKKIIPSIELQNKIVSCGLLYKKYQII